MASVSARMPHVDEAPARMTVKAAPLAMRAGSHLLATQAAPRPVIVPDASHPQQ